MGRKLVKKPTVGHLWTVSPLPLLMLLSYTRYKDNDVVYPTTLPF